MKLEIKMKLNKHKKCLIKLWYKLVYPLATLEEKIRNNNYLRCQRKIDCITEEEFVNRIVKNIEKKISKDADWWEEFHICSYGDYPDRNIIEYCRDCSQDKIIKSCSYKYKHGDMESYSRLTEMLYEKLKNNSIMNIEWKVYDNYKWLGNYTYIKTLCISVKDEFK